MSLVNCSSPARGKRPGAGPIAVVSTLALLAGLFLPTWVAGEDTAVPAQSPGWIDPEGIQGALVIVGGGELPAEVTGRFMKLAGEAKARIVVIPTAADNADEVITNADQLARLLEPWKALGAADVQVLHTRSRTEADEGAFTESLRQATGVWLEGGSQSKLAEAYVGTAVEKELLALLARGGVIGGTSAGAAIQCRTMIASGNPDPQMAIGLDLLPGSIIDQHFLARNRRPRLITALTNNPGLVGLGVDEGTALIVQGRKLEVLGKSTVSVIFAPSTDGSLPVREFELKAGAAHDLTMLRRVAVSRTQPRFPPPEVPPTKLAAGSLVIVGGGGMPKEIVDKFIELAGGPDAPIVVLPTANPPLNDEGRSENREGAFLRRAGAKNVTILRQRTKAEVESPEFEAAMTSAKGVWFGGGRQWRFVDTYAGTRAEEWIRGVLQRDGVIGGSSAGATIQGDYLVRGSVLGNEEMMAEGYERGLGYLPGSAIDQHFAQRKRFADMTGVMKRHPQLLGIGIDEATAVIVRGQTAEIMGPGKAHFYDYRAGPPTGEQDYTSLGSGEKFDLVERKKTE